MTEITCYKEKGKHQPKMACLNGNTEMLFNKRNDKTLRKLTSYDTYNSSALIK